MDVAARCIPNTGITTWGASSRIIVCQRNLVLCYQVQMQGTKRYNAFDYGTGPGRLGVPLILPGLILIRPAVGIKRSHDMGMDVYAQVQCLVTVGDGSLMLSRLKAKNCQVVMGMSVIRVNV